MWTRRVLLATLIAAAAMSLPRQLPASFGPGGFAMANVAGSSR